MKTNKPVKEIDDLALVPCLKHRDCVIGCRDCKVAQQIKYYILPERARGTKC